MGNKKIFQILRNSTVYNDYTTAAAAFNVPADVTGLIDGQLKSARYVDGNEEKAIIGIWNSTTEKWSMIDIESSLLHAVLNAKQINVTDPSSGETKALDKVIFENETATAASLNDLNEKIMAIENANFGDSIGEITAKIAAIESDIDGLVKTDNSSADLNIGDDKGNVLLRLAKGHIKTKNFDSEKVNQYVTGYSYTGQRIDVMEYQYGRELLLTEVTSSNSSKQGSACFDKFLFQFHNTNDYVSIFNLDTKEKIYEIKLQDVSTYHCNNANFGNEKYEQNDFFPLLYVSQENSEEHKCIVYRVIKSEQTFSLTLVQTITLPVPSDNFLWYPNIIIDQKMNKLVVSGLSNNPWSGGVDNILRYKVFSLPKLREGDVILDESKIEDSFEFKNHPTPQGGFIKNNKIYQVFGMGNNAQLKVIDIVSHIIVSQIELWNTGLAIEPEGCFLYDNTICINFANGNIYKLKF